LADLIVNSNRIVVFTGAGISTESGLRDFRGPNGIWTKSENPTAATFQKFLIDPEVRKRHWARYGSGEFQGNVKPNRAHHAITELEKMGKLNCVITQNIDGLHQKAGNNPDNVIELHGTVTKAKCLECGRSYPIEEMRPRLEAGEESPNCLECGGLMKVATISFGQAMPVEETQEAQQRSAECDLCIVIGSTLVVYPAAHMPEIALNAGAMLAIINIGDTPLDDVAHVRISEKAGDVMGKVMQMVKQKMQD
ncbi:NAD-dependent deacetylase, partial [Chloroflexota bacterium]